MEESLEKVLWEATKRQVLSSFLELKDTKKYSEAIPEGEELKELLHTPDGLFRFKCGKFFFGEVLRGANIVSDNVSDEARLRCDEIKIFIKSLDPKFERGELASHEEIKKANSFLDVIIAELQK
jgi:hypothetical protein